MSGYQPSPFTETRPARLIQRDGEKIIEIDNLPPERVSLGEKIGFWLLAFVSVAITAGSVWWILRHGIPTLWGPR